MTEKIIQELGKGGVGSILIIMFSLVALVYWILKDQNRINEKREIRLTDTIEKNQSIIFSLSEKISVVEEVKEELAKQGNKLDRIDTDIKEIKNKL